MITDINFTKNWIQSKNSSKTDRSETLEKVVYAISSSFSMTLVKYILSRHIWIITNYQECNSFNPNNVAF